MSVSGCTAPKPSAQRLLFALAGRDPIERPRKTNDGYYGCGEKEDEDCPAAITGSCAPLERFRRIGFRLGFRRYSDGFGHEVGFAGEAHASRCLVGARQKRLNRVAHCHQRVVFDVEGDVEDGKHLAQVIDNHNHHMTILTL
jgi:hypothetical protein